MGNWGYDWSMSTHHFEVLNVIICCQANDSVLLTETHDSTEGEAIHLDWERS